MLLKNGMPALRMDREAAVLSIYKQELDRPARFSSLFIEEFFVRAFGLSKRARERYEGFSTGWCYVSGKERGVRSWLRIRARREGRTFAEDQFIQKACAFGHSAFEVQCEWRTLAGSYVPSVQVHELQSGGSDVAVVRSSGAFALENELNARLVSVDWGRVENFERVFDNWFSAFSEDQLVQLASFRALMNFGLNHAVDIDGLAWHRGEKRPVIFEFKRKDPMLSLLAPVSSHNGFDPVLVGERLRVVLGSCSGKDLAQRGACLAALEKSNFGLGLTRRSEFAFGLDMNHFETVRFCGDAGIGYRYLIWNQKVKVQGVNRSTLRARSDELAQLLSSDLRPIGKGVYLARSIDSIPVDGLSYTIGADSGSYNRGPRVQVAFLMEGFER